jgi:hypothetical protein
VLVVIALAHAEEHVRDRVITRRTQRNVMRSHSRATRLLVIVPGQISALKSPILCRGSWD